MSGVPKAPATSQSASAPLPHSDAASLVRRRFEDTALVIFQQHIKQQKQASPGLYRQLSSLSLVSTSSPLSLPTPPSPSPPLLRASPGRARDPDAAGTTSEDGVTPGGEASPDGWETPGVFENGVEVVGGEDGERALSVSSSSSPPDGAVMVAEEGEDSLSDSSSLNSEGASPEDEACGDGEVGEVSWAPSSQDHRPPSAHDVLARPSPDERSPPSSPPSSLPDTTPRERDYSDEVLRTSSPTSPTQSQVTVKRLSVGEDSCSQAPLSSRHSDTERELARAGEEEVEARAESDVTQDASSLHSDHVTSDGRQHSWRDDHPYSDDVRRDDSQHTDDVKEVDDKQSDDDHQRHDYYYNSGDDPVDSDPMAREGRQQHDLITATRPQTWSAACTTPGGAADPAGACDGASEAGGAVAVSAETGEGLSALPVAPDNRTYFPQSGELSRSDVDTLDPHLASDDVFVTSDDTVMRDGHSEGGSGSVTVLRADADDDVMLASRTEDEAEGGHRQSSSGDRVGHK